MANDAARIEPVLLAGDRDEGLEGMFTARITAENAVLFVDAESGHSTKVAYQSDRPVAIWYRHNLYVWIRLVLDRTGRLPRAAKSGSFRSPDLLPGDIVEYRIYEDMQHNPSYGPVNAAGISVPYDAVTLMGLRRRPCRMRPPSYSRHEQRRIGCRFLVGTPGVVSHVSVEAAREAPVEGPLGAPYFRAPDLSLLSLHRQTHRLDLQPLLPTTDYHVVLRYSDRDGNWWCEKSSFATPRRPLRAATLVDATRPRLAIPSNM